MTTFLWFNHSLTHPASHAQGYCVCGLCSCFDLSFLISWKLIKFCSISSSPDVILNVYRWPHLSDMCASRGAVDFHRKKPVEKHAFLVGVLGSRVPYVSWICAGWCHVYHIFRWLYAGWCHVYRMSQWLCTGWCHVYRMSRWLCAGWCHVYRMSHDYMLGGATCTVCPDFYALGGASVPNVSITMR